MSTINVNGGSIPNAIAAAAAGDTLELGSFTYPGFKCAKRLHFRGTPIIEGTYQADTAQPGNVIELTDTADGASIAGAFTIRGALRKHGANLLIRGDDVLVDGVTTEDGAAGYGIRHYQCDRVTIRNWTARRVAFGIQFNGKATGSVLEDFDFTDINRMIVADATPGNDTGATGIDFFKTVGPVIVRRGKMTNLRAPSPDYVYDGGAIAVYGGAKNVTVEDVEIRNALNVFEDGKASTDPDNANFVLRRIKAYGPPTLGTSKADYCQGVLVRAMQGMTWEDFEFTDLDGFGNFYFSHDGSYAGGLSGVALTGQIVLKDGALAYTVNTGVSMSAVTYASTVSYARAGQNIASVAGKGATASLATFKSWGAQATNEVWQPQETEVERLTRELAESEAALAAMTIERNTALLDLAAVTVERNTYKTAIESIHAIAHEVGL